MKILTASEVIAVNQDPLGVAGDLVWKEGPIEVSCNPPKSSWNFFFISSIMLFLSTLESPVFYTLLCLPRNKVC